MDYDPRHHDLLEGIAQPGDRVTICHAGYYHGDRLLFRAKVKPTYSPLPPSSPMDSGD
ncbi:hypothetical protein [Neosynechococcus sphagnicola]|uniref:hypothetical protein n=1 Tax=Neosynechococcus sphagnicola TaxID=1501145 RepID=UPI0012E04435|nr:hypothetical protein [Neosynechococcus sphagnicola]